jgi:ABC-type glycerol-3-phosphate transport system substrate-binding protein
VKGGATVIWINLIEVNDEPNLRRKDQSMSSNGTLNMSRREFIKIAAGSAGALIMAACAPAVTPTPIPPPTQVSVPGAVATAVPTAAPAVTVPPTIAANVPVTWWRSLTGTNGEMLEAMVKDFNASQKAVTVKSEYQGVYADLRDKLSAAVAAGLLPSQTWSC